MSEGNGQPPAEEVKRWPVRRSRLELDTSGRPFEIAVPPDLTDEELLDIIQWAAAPTGLRASLQRQSNIITPPQFLRPT